MWMSRNQYCKLARDCIETPLKSDIGVLSICDCKPTRASCFTPIFTHTACSTTFLPEVAHGRNKSNSPCSGWMDPGEIQALELQTLYSEGCRKIIMAVPCRYHTCRNIWKAFIFFDLCAEHSKCHLQSSQNPYLRVWLPIGLYRCESDEVGKLEKDWGSLFNWKSVWTLSIMSTISSLVRFFSSPSNFSCFSLRPLASLLDLVLFLGRYL